MAEIAVDDEPFRVRVDGPEDARVILLSNSLGCDLTMWDDVVPYLAAKYRVIRYDSRGHGGSVVVARPTSIAEMAEDALNILNQLDVERAHFIGLSMGGMVGQWLLTHAPDRLGRVVLCNTAAMMGPPDLWNARIAAARSGMAGLVEPTMSRWFTPEFRAAEPGKVARIADLFAATAPEGYASCCAAIRDMDQRWPVRAARGQVTVIVGSRDPSTTPQDGRLIAEAIPGARMVTLEAAHLSCIERPQEFAAAALAAIEAPARKPVAARKPAPRSRPARAAVRRAARLPAAEIARMSKPRAASDAKAGAESAGAKKAAAVKAASKKATGKAAQKAASRKAAAKKIVSSKAVSSKGASRKANSGKTASKAGVKTSTTKKVVAAKAATKGKAAKAGGAARKAAKSAAKGRRRSSRRT